MQIHLSPRHLTLTAAIHGHVASKISHLEEIVENILAAHVVLIHDEKRNPSRAFHVKVHLAVPGPDIYAEDAESDLYAAIDKVTSKLARQLRKRKTRIVDQKKRKLQRTLEKKRSGRS